MNSFNTAKITKKVEPAVKQVLLLILFNIINYMIPSARSFSCHFHAEANTSSNLVSAFQPKTLLALVQSPQIFSISPSRRGPYFQDSIQEARDAGCNEFISKPFKVDHLIETIEKFI